MSAPVVDAADRIERYLKVRGEVMRNETGFVHRIVAHGTTADLSITDLQMLLESADYTMFGTKMLRLISHALAVWPVDDDTYSLKEVLAVYDTIEAMLHDM